MVSFAYNDLITKNGVRMAEMVSDFEKALAMFAKISNDLHDIDAKLSNDVLDVDEFTTSGIAVQTTFRPQKNYYLPIVVEYILAVFPVASTSVTIQMGPRIIPVANIAAGVFVADTRMQLEKDDDRVMTIAPAGIGFFEVMGRATKQVMDRP